MGKLVFNRKDGNYVYNIELKNNDEILDFVQAVRWIDANIVLVGVDGDAKCTVSAKSLLGAMYASVLSDLRCVSDVNIIGEIAHFIVEDEDSN